MGPEKMEPFLQAIEELVVFAERTFEEACNDHNLPLLLAYAKTCGLL